MRTARSFRVWEGGGEYNVARGLRRCFGLRTAIVTALADNDIGRLVEDLMLQGGVDTSLVRWVPYDGIGRGGAQRPQLHRARLRRARRARRLRPRQHRRLAARARASSTGTTCSASSACAGCTPAGSSRRSRRRRPQVIEEAVAAAARHGTVVSYDLNYRPSLWKAIGGVERAREVNRRLAGHVDVMIGNEEDFTACLGLEVEGVDENLSELDTAAFRVDDRARRRRSFRTSGSSPPRSAPSRSATVNDWGAIAWSRDDGLRRGDAPPGPRDPGSRRRRRQLRLGPDLRADGARRPTSRRRVRRRTRRTRDDDARRHLDRDARRGGGTGAGRGARVQR